MGRDGPRRDVLVVLGGLVLLGAVCGVLWSLLVTPAEFTKQPGGGSMDEVELGKRFAADGWYVVLGGVAGLAAGAGLTWWRRRDPLLTSGLLAVGSVAAAAVMSLVGHLLGPGPPQAALAKVAVGGTVPERLAVHGRVVYLVWPIAVLLGALVILWGRAPEPRDEAGGDDGSGSETGTGVETGADSGDR